MSKEEGRPGTAPGDGSPLQSGKKRIRLGGARPVAEPDATTGPDLTWPVAVTRRPSKPIPVVVKASSKLLAIVSGGRPEAYSIGLLWGEVFQGEGDITYEVDVTDLEIAPPPAQDAPEAMVQALVAAADVVRSRNQASGRGDVVGWVLVQPGKGTVPDDTSVDVVHGALFGEVAWALMLVADPAGGIGAFYSWDETDGRRVMDRDPGEDWRVFLLPRAPAPPTPSPASAPQSRLRIHGQQGRSAQTREEHTTATPGARASRRLPAWLLLVALLPILLVVGAVVAWLAWPDRLAEEPDSIMDASADPSSGVGSLRLDGLDGQGGSSGVGREASGRSPAADGDDTSADGGTHIADDAGGGEPDMAASGHLDEEPRRDAEVSASTPQYRLEEVRCRDHGDICMRIEPRPQSGLVLSSASFPNYPFYAIYPSEIEPGINVFTRHRGGGGGGFAGRICAQGAQFRASHFEPVYWTDHTIAMNKVRTACSSHDEWHLCFPPETMVVIECLD